MYLKAIQDYDEFSNEADLIISDGEYDLLCYCHPTELYAIGTSIISISSFCADNIMRTKSNSFLVLKLNGYYEYHLRGEIVDINIPVVQIGKLKIMLDNSLPKDIKLGEYIEFDTLRLNCYF